ncbi:MAG: hypothetical protein JSW61_06345 [Candidatus Thorarchaeota archaeon]|nr:MAG: hypothetical protein JSW61_06345 [Candidatus Thorarchaeota archaeon]
MSEDKEQDTKKERKRRGEQTEAEEVGEILGVVTEQIPKLISGLIGSVYSPEAAASMAAAIGGFYRKLKEEGIPEEMALELTKKYVAGLDFMKFMDQVSISDRGIKTSRDFDDDED